MSIAAFVLVSLLSSEAQTARERLVRARELFQQNRWADARVELNSELGSLPEGERTQARLMLGLSYVKEAELYRSLHRFAVDVGLDYLSELAASKENAGVVWIPLFKGIYQLEGGLDDEAERSLGSAASSKALPAEVERARAAPSRRCPLPAGPPPGGKRARRKRQRQGAILVRSARGFRRDRASRG